MQPKKLLYKWYSICSRHQQYDENCELCNIGHWVFIPGIFFSKIFPRFWMYVKNTKKAKQIILNQY